MPVRIVEDCIGIATSSAALESVCRGMDVLMIPTEASETDSVLRGHATKLGFKRVIKDCNDKRRFNGKKRRKPHVYTCGFACQPFSAAGNNGGLNDERSSSMKGAVKYIKKEVPLVFILENVRNFAVKHRRVKNKLVRRLLKTKKYQLHEQILNSRSFGGIQNRQRWYLVGVHKALAKDAEFVFQWPKGRGPKMVGHVLDAKFDDVPVTLFNKTIQRNWVLVEEILNTCKSWANHSGPWIADLMQSQSRGAYVCAAVPTITKSHAPNNAYWLVVLADKSAKGLTKRRYVKRPLGLKDVLLAQGWAAGAVAKFKDIPEKAMLGALGNAMSLNVMRSLWMSLKPLLSALNDNDIEVSSKL